MDFNEKTVSEAVSVFKRFAEKQCLGSPVWVALDVEGRGVGVEWPGEVRKAIGFKEYATRPGDVAETKRRLEDWASESRPGS